MTVLYGLLGLSVIIFIHELGHFFVARFFGVHVESFSIGMGPVLLHKTVKGTDYRLSLIPFGGYCGMKGEKDFQTAMENKLDRIPAEKDSFYGVHPLKRIAIAFAGPFANVILAVAALSVVAMIGYDYYTSPNKIILASEFYPDSPLSAAEAGLQTGDRITAINGKRIEYFSDIVEAVSLAARKTLYIEADRNGTAMTFTLVPELDKSTGAGKIGVLSWLDPVIESAAENSPAFNAGLQNGDRIIEADGKTVRNTVDLYEILKNLHEADISVERGGRVFHAHLSLASQDGQSAQKSPAQKSAERKNSGNENLVSGISWQAIKVHTKTYPFFPALFQGAKETFKMVSVTAQSIALLFKGIDLKQAVSGPIGITVLLGETAKEGFSAGFSVGVVTVCNFLAVISISLFLMNLLPVPVLDGGLILVAFIELVRRKSIKPKTLYAIQIAGVCFIVVIFLLGMFADINRIIQRFQDVKL
ncbi:RIP metalloprotease RseP [Treponema maltophilum]|uniref:RIP metalloprotease RseP n=1 Tax=Treponema maltophilum TaxID=51160 RepID=UPI003D8F6E44